MTKRSRPWGYQDPIKKGTKRNLHPETQAVRGGLIRSGFGETGEALFLTSGFSYDSAEQAEAAFNDQGEHYLYSRFANPTITMFEERIAALEGAEAAHATASGMAAMFASVACLVSAGDRVVAAPAMFSSCYVVLTEILPKWGIEVEILESNSIENWKAALKKKTKVVFIETPSNPLLEITDIAAVAKLAHQAGATVIVDNVMASPVLQKPLQLGADVVMYSATKHMDGQGRVLGGVILGTKKYIEQQLKPFTRHTGPALSPFNAWLMLKSLETMQLRVQKMSDSALRIAKFLASQSKVAKVHYPFLSTHRGQKLAKKQMLGGGTTIAFELKGGKTAAFRFLNKLEVIDISNNLGDSKSLATHPASSTHRRLSKETLEKMEITPGLIRLSVGLEHPDDLIDDIRLAL